MDLLWTAATSYLSRSSGGFGGGFVGGRLHFYPVPRKDTGIFHLCRFLLLRNKDCPDAGLRGIAPGQSFRALSGVYRAETFQRIYGLRRQDLGPPWNNSCASRSLVTLGMNTQPFSRVWAGPLLPSPTLPAQTGVFSLDDIWNLLIVATLAYICMPYVNSAIYF